MTGGAVKEKWQVNSALLPFSCPRYAGECGCEPSWKEQGGGNQCPQLLQLPSRCSLGQAGGSELHPLLVLQGWVHECPGMQQDPQHPAWCPAGRLPELFVRRQCILPVESSTPVLVWKPTLLEEKRLFSLGSLHCSFQPELHSSFASQFSYVVSLHP